MSEYSCATVTPMQNTPLHMCALEGHAQVVLLLLAHNAHISLNREGATFFDMLVQRHHKNALMAAVRHDRCARRPHSHSSHVLGGSCALSVNLKDPIKDTSTQRPFPQSPNYNILSCVCVCESLINDFGEIVWFLKIEYSLGNIEFL